MFFFTSPVLKVLNEYLTNEAPERFGDFIREVQVFRTLKCAEELVLLAKEERAIRAKIDRLFEIGICYGVETNMCVCVCVERGGGN